MTKQSLQAFNAYLARTCSPEWGTECVVGLIKLANPIATRHDNNFKYLISEALELMCRRMINLAVTAHEWDTRLFLRHFNHERYQELETDIGETLRCLSLPVGKRGLAALEALVIKETSGELESLAPDVHELNQAYFIKITWDTQESDEPYVFIVPAEELFKNALQGVEQDLDYYLMNQK